MRPAWPGLVMILVPIMWLATTAAQQPPAPVPGSPRQMAQADLTGYWVAQITEDWRWRMVTPPKGDFSGVPLNATGRKVGESWDLARDTANGNLCRSFGAGGLMRHPLRVRISWRDDNTLQLETDLGQQTRLFRFTQAAASGPRSLQGYSVAQWTRPVIPPRGRGPGPAAPAPAGGGAVTPPPGGLKVITTHLLAGYLRPNGVPYSENAIVTEYYDRLLLFGSDYLQLVTVVEDPTYLLQPFVVSNQFKREPDGSRWRPQPCRVDAPVGTLHSEPGLAPPAPPR